MDTCTDHVFGTSVKLQADSVLLRFPDDLQKFLHEHFRVLRLFTLYVDVFI